jgi:sulfur-oxidizing protein SoxX
MIRIHRITLALAAGLCASMPALSDDAALDKKFAEMLKQDFQAKGIAKLDRLDQDAVQQSCTKFNNTPPHDGPLGLDKLEPAQMAAIKWPADGKYMGDWKAGEKLAQDGRGMTWSDKEGTPSGGNCYNCHQLAPQELSYGTIGPSLYHFGKIRGNTPENQKYAYGKIYNAKAYNLCTNMPRLGHVGALTEAQIKDLVALLLDPESAVNK